MELRNVLSRCMLLILMLTVCQMGVAKPALPDFTSLVKSSSPAVVNISTVQKDKQDSASLPGEGNPQDWRDMPEIFKHFFGEDFRLQPYPPHPQEQNSGSGFILSSDGYILTNNHVVQGAKDIMVRLNDRRELEAELVGADKASDLALLKVKAQNLPTVKVGDSDKLEVGEWVLAIGSPFGFDYSVTSGIVSALGRSLPKENYVPFIQTDVAINPGNSGGPLFDLNGNVVGINSQIYTRSGGFMGLSFAIPINVAMDVVDQLKAHGHVSRGWLGVLIQEVNKDLAESFGLDKPAGALVAQVLPDSPAEKAGVKEGDIIVQFNGQEIDLSSDLPHLVGRTRAGKSVPLLVVREGARQTLSVNVGELPADDSGNIITSKSKSKGHNRLKISVSDLSKELKEKWELESGVSVDAVSVGPGRDSGLRRGDVITMIDGHSISNTKIFNDVVKGLPDGRSVPMRIIRRGNPTFLPLKLPEKSKD